MHALLCLCTLAALAQAPESAPKSSGGFSVTGTVTGGADAELALVNEDGSTAARTVTGAGGRFRLVAQEAGHYRLALWRGGRAYIIQEVLLSSAEPHVVVAAVAPQPFATTAAGEQPAPQDPLIDAGRLAQRVPKRARRFYEQALEKRRRGDSEEAIGLFERALQEFPDYPEALNNVAVLYQRRQDYSRAEQRLRRAIALDPASWQPHLNLGIVLLAQERYQEAQQEMERSRVLAPRSPLPDFHLGRLHMMEERADEAERAFDRALAAQPQFPIAQLFRGYARWQAGRLAEARDDLASYLRQAPGASDAAQIRQRLAQLDQKLAPKDR